MDKEIILKVLKQIEQKLEIIRLFLDSNGENNEEKIEDIDLSKAVKPLPTVSNINLSLKEGIKDEPKEEKKEEKIKDQNRCEKCNKKLKKGKLQIIDENLVQEFICKKCKTSKFIKQAL